MRAYLSDPTLTECRREWLRSASHMGAAAETIAQREAARIISRTEPAETGMSDIAHVSLSDLHGVRHAPVFDREGAIAHVALTEALARFLS